MVLVGDIPLEKKRYFPFFNIRTYISSFTYIFQYNSCLQLAYLPYKRRDLILEEENIDLYVNLEGNAASADDSPKEEKKTKKHGLLNWLKSRVSCPLLFAISNPNNFIIVTH
jgi:hypothetical protein